MPASAGLRCLDTTHERSSGANPAAKGVHITCVFPRGLRPGLRPPRGPDNSCRIAGQQFERLFESGAWPAAARARTFVRLGRMAGWMLRPKVCRLDGCGFSFSREGGGEVSGEVGPLPLRHARGCRGLAAAIIAGAGGFRGRVVGIRRVLDTEQIEQLRSRAPTFRFLRA